MQEEVDELGCTYIHVEEGKALPTMMKEVLFDLVSHSKPAVFVGALKLEQWPALHKWTNSYLKEKFGESSVHVKITPDGQFEGCEDLKLWEIQSPNSSPVPPTVLSKLQSPDKVVVRPADVEMKFSEFMDMLYNKEAGNVSFYLEYTSITGSLEAMGEDIAPVSFAHFLDEQMRNVWIGNGRTLGKLHFDPYDNLLCQIAGSKELTLFDPYHNENLYEGHIREAAFSVDLPTLTFKRDRLTQSTSMVMSPVDITKPDLERYPLFRKASRIQCTIHSGDILFLPAFWWHEVQSRPDAVLRNIAVNFWYSPFLTKDFPCASCPLKVSSQYNHLIPLFYNLTSTD